MKSLERHFNQWFNYPWVFLNDEPFDKEFRSKVTEVTNSDVEFGLIPKKEWDFPEDVDQDLLHEAIESQGDRGILYGNMESYHKMCRFYSGYFYEHELVKNRDWYWRVEPDVEFYCDITYDPFLELEKNNKKYGFTVLIHELYYTVPGLFRETKKYILQQSSNFKVGNLWNLFIHDSKYTTGDEKGEYSEYSKKEDILRAIEKNVIIRKYLELKEDSESSILENPQIIKEIMNRMAKMPKLYEDRIDREEYNLCHFWSNFEIARVDLFRDPFYQGYFQHLDKSGGFYMERWGDAPVHSLGIAMMLDTKDVHYFRDIGYRHSVLLHCPHNSPNQLPYKRSSNYVNNLLSPKEEKYWLAFDEVNPEISGGSGCRCRCPDLWDMEDRSSCFTKWQEITSDGYVPMEPLDVPRWEKEIDRRWERVLDSGGLIGEKLVLLPSDWR